MVKPNVTIGVRKVTATTCVLDIKGEITGFAEEALMDAYNRAASQGARTICLNFTDLEYMNSSGIGLLVTLLVRVQRQKQKLLAFGLSDHYQQIFGLTRLNEVIGIYPTEADAVYAAV